MELQVKELKPVKVPYILPRDVFICKHALNSPLLELCDEQGNLIYPERRPTGNSFMDEFSRLVHTYGVQRAEFYAKKMGIGNTADLCATIRTLSGVDYRVWVSCYMVYMIDSLTGTYTSMARYLHQGSVQGMLQSYHRYKKLANNL